MTMEFESVKKGWFGGYYGALNEKSGRLPLDDASHNIAQNLARLAGGIVHSGDTLRIRQEILDAVQPSDFKQSAIDITSRVLNNNGYAFPWTVGDEELQKAKLEQGQFRLRLQAGLIDPSSINRYKEFICTEYKLIVLPEIYEICAAGGVTDIYVADDNEETIKTINELSQLLLHNRLPLECSDMAVKLYSMFQEIAEKYSQLPNLHNFHIKPDERNDPAGSFDAFAAMIRGVIAESDTKKLNKILALVLDVDETMMHTKLQLDRAAASYFEKYLQ